MKKYIHYIPEDGIRPYVARNGKNCVRVIFLCGAKTGNGTGSGMHDCKKCDKLLKKSK